MSAMPDTAVAIQVRVRGPLFTQLEAWRRAQAEIPARSEAVRQLLRKGLAAAGAEKSTKKQSA
jgi:metal-responsive CopG/Arc/MetJ family transcriptional regulator